MLSSRLVFGSTVGCAAFAMLLALPSLQANAGPTRDHRQSNRAPAREANDWQTMAADGSRGLILAASIDERLQPGGPIVSQRRNGQARAANPSRRFNVVRAAAIGRSSNAAAGSSNERAASREVRSNHRGDKRRNHAPASNGQPSIIEVPWGFEGTPGDAESAISIAPGSAPIPEPSSILLYAAGAALIGFIARKKLV